MKNIISKSFYLVLLVVIFSFVIIEKGFAQSATFSKDIINVDDSINADIYKESKFNFKSLIVPSIFMGYGIIGLGSDWTEGLDIDTNNEIHENINYQFPFDDYAQYSPMISVYALNLFGVKGLHNFKDRTIILATSYLIMGATVNVLKNSIREERPDHSSYNSFPSGHTATAFMGAEFLRREYNDVSPWIGVGGYLVAAGTGYFRLQNNRHWITDISMGAGIGIISTEIAYWLFPYTKKIFKKRKKMSIVALPKYDGKTIGLGLTIDL